MFEYTLASSLDDILKELDASYNPQRQSIQSRIDALPAQADAEIAGLKGTQDQAFGDILNGARDRGLGFSGIPLAEQAKYTSSTFLPAVARVRSSQNDTKSSLFDALNNVNLDQNKYAQSLRQAQLDRDEQQRQFNETQAAQKRAADQQAAMYGGLYGNNNAQPGQQGNAVPASVMSQRADKGFNFTDASGKPISAAQYSAAKNIPFRTLLQEMANAGDAGAKQALGFVGNDYGYDPSRINNASLAGIYNNLVWGTGKQATYQAPAPSVHNQVVNTFNNAKSSFAKGASTGFVTQPDTNTLRAAYANARR